MNHQLLFDIDIRPMVAGRGATLQERFEDWWRANEWLESALVALCRDAVRRGQQRVGMKMLFEVLRWEHGRSTVGDTWRMNNSYASRAARRIAEKYPDLAHLFVMRELKAAS